MSAADSLTAKCEEEAALVDRLVPKLVEALWKRPLYRWQVWLEFAEKEGLSASQAVALIERARKGRLIFEQEGRLFAGAALSRKFSDGQ